MSAAWKVMGVCNATPDSFSDGGMLPTADAAVAHSLQMVKEGAQIIDVGGESTRPGADPVGETEELRRVIPVIEGIAAAQSGAQISVDTTKVAVAKAALDAGASYVNDVSGFSLEPEMAVLVAEAGCDCCLMHMNGTPLTMQQDPHYDDVVAEVSEYLGERAQAAIEAGIARERIAVDPGIGFGKSLDHNLELLAGLGRIAMLGYPVVVGVSRKRFLGELTGADSPEQRVAATVAANVVALSRGASVFRVHDVRANVDGLRVASATLARDGR
ncbi:MAG: dihydropteroate synthase [Actinobacteria bacterium]|uniref:dihydropteroate synthase n=1 Tax=freshwater metagenome TaxID=449393 RepID=A0A6J5ZP78_9ZZZZ|nr:dihydropteroate synthase [Actinomycetota bacterium]